MLGAAAIVGGTVVYLHNQSTAEANRQSVSDAYGREQTAAVTAYDTAGRLTAGLNYAGPDHDIPKASALIGTVEDASGKPLYRNVLLLSCPEVCESQTDDNGPNLTGAWIGYMASGIKTDSVSIEPRPWLPGWQLVSDDRQRPIETDLDLHLNIISLSSGLLTTISANHPDPRQPDYGDVGIVGQVIIQ